MRSLERYLLREFCIPLAYCLFAFTLIVIVFELFDTLADFINWRASFTEITRYYVLLLPSTLSTSLPMALLLALLYSLATFSKSNELIAMRACGLSLQRLMLPYLGAGAAASLVLFVLNETIAPRSLEQARQWAVAKKEEWRQSVEFLKDKQKRLQQQAAMDPKRAAKRAKQQRMNSLFFYNSQDHRHWVIQEFDPAQKLVTNGVEVLQQDARGHDVWKAMAAWGKYLDGHWWFFDVRMLDLTGETPRMTDSSRQRIMNELTETPRQLAAELKEPDQMTVKELRNYLSMHRSASDERLAPFRVNLHQRYAQPWSCLVMVLLGISMGGRVGRQGPLVGVASSLGLFVAYWFVLQVGLRAGEGAYLSPALAAWSANGIFGLIGLGGYSTLR